MAVYASWLRRRRQACRLAMQIVQHNFNFGALVKTDNRSRVLVVKNLSEMPLLYRVRRSGRFSSSKGCAGAPPPPGWARGA